MKKAFAETFIRCAGSNDKALLLTGDFCYGMFDEFKKERPRQYINCGTAEQSMVGVAAGLAIGGFTPFVYAICPFILDRAWEQIKLDIAQQQLKVILVGFADYPNDGPSHSEVSVSMLKLLKWPIQIFEPQTVKGVVEATEAAYFHTGPSFIKLKNAPKQENAIHE